MTTYTTQPDDWWPSTHTAILEDGKRIMSVPHGQETEAIDRHKASHDVFWSKITARTDDRLVIAKGTAYSIGSPSDNPRGFGGSVWRINFHDGRSVRCVSLWCLGDVPSDWRDRLPDNATLKEIGYEPR